VDSALSWKAEASGSYPDPAPCPRPCRRNKFAQMQEFNTQLRKISSRRTSPRMSIVKIM